MASIMNALSLFFLSLLLATSAQAALNGQCTANGKPGTCISTSACNSAGGTSVSGFCTNDPTDVKCCYKDSCDSGKGSCKWTSQCSGSSVPGYCPGPTNFQCCEAAGSPSNIYSAITTYADSHWNCIDPACSGTVQAGKAQEIFKCAEFVARSLAAGGFVPTLSSDSPRSAYESYVYGGKKYNLLWVSSKPPHGGPVGLEEFLIATGWHTVLPLTATNVHAGSVVFMNGWGHVAIGVGENLLDAHNMARKHVDLNFYSNFDLKAIYFK